MKLSIVIPMYNVENYIVECLDSILNQWVSDVEVICIDDGSTDDSYNLACQYKRKQSLSVQENFMVLSQKNIGLSGTRNNGVALSSGEYIAFIDSDDMVRSDFLESILYEISKNNKPDIIEFNMEYSTGGIIQVCVGNNSLVDRFKIGHWYACARVYKKNILADGFKLGINYEDMWLVPELYLQANKIVEINKALYWYRYNENGITQSLSQKNIEKSILSFNIILDKYRNLRMDDSLKDILLIHVLYISTIYILKNRSFEDSFNFYKKQNIRINLKNCIYFTFRMNIFIYFGYVYLYLFKKYRI